MNLSIVVVDDETPICDWLIYCIKNASDDYIVASASNGEEALSLIMERKPDLVFTDICMPGMDGLELMRRVLKIFPFTVFAILTNYAEFSYAKEAITLGAREYFLKAELRAADIRTLLEKVLEAKKKVRMNKRLEVLPGGEIDLYNFYNNLEQPGYGDRFWEQQGMKEAVPFQMLCCKTHPGQERWQDTVRLRNMLQSAREQAVYFAVARGKSNKYIIIQSDGDLQAMVSELAGRLTEYDSVGISTVIKRREEVFRGLHESNRALNMSFFRDEAEVVYYESLLENPSLNQTKIQEEKKNILLKIQQCRYTEAEKQLYQCYEQLKNMGPEDTFWVIDFMKRLVLAVEEIYYQQSDGGTQKIEIMTSGRQCLDRCIELIGKMKKQYQGRHSRSISVALEYIHKHYMENISMAEAARYVCHSPEYFSRRFKEEVGENFNTYVTLYRLDRAQELLCHTNLYISEIADQVGFSSPGYFARLYKRYKGITPEQERMSKM